MTFDEEFKLLWLRCTEEQSQSFVMEHVKYQRHWRGKFLSEKKFVCVFPSVNGKLHLVAKNGKMLDCPMYYYDAEHLSKLIVYPLEQSPFDRVADLKRSLLGLSSRDDQNRLINQKRELRLAKRAEKESLPSVRLNQQLKEADFSNTLVHSMKFLENSGSVAQEIIQGIAENISVNRRRSKNFALVTGEVLELDVELNNGRWSLALPGQELIYSTIPYDMSKRYIAFLSTLDTYESGVVENFLNDNIQIYDVYLKKGLRLTKEQIIRQHKLIEQDNRFKICIAGRILQHLDTGPLTASLPDKMLYQLVTESGTIDFVEEVQSFLRSANVNPAITLASALGLTVDEYLTAPLTQTMKGYLS